MAQKCQNMRFTYTYSDNFRPGWKTCIFTFSYKYFKVVAALKASQMLINYVP